MATPDLVQQVQTSFENIAGAVQLVIPLPNPVLSGNLVCVFFQYNNGLTLGTVTDNGSNALTAGPTAVNATTTLACYYLANDTFGSTSIVVNFTGTLTSVPARLQAEVSEWYNVATSTPTDGTGSSTNSVTTSAIVTTVAGDLILYAAAAVAVGSVAGGGGFNGTSIGAGAGQTLLSADLLAGFTAQYIIQGSAGSISPTSNPSGSVTWASVAIAFKNATAGTAPSPTAMRVVSVYTCGFLGSTGTAPLPVQFPSRGNLLVGLWNSGDAGIKSITDSAGNHWNCWNLTNQVLGSVGHAQQVFAQNASTSNGLIITPTLAVSSAGTDILKLFDIVNASTTPFASASLVSGTQSSSTGTLAAGSITPQVAGGLIMATVAVAFHTLTTCAVSHGTPNSDTVYNTFDDNGTGGTAPSNLDEDNGYCHVYNADTTAVAFTYSYLFGKASNAGVGAWAAVVIAFNPASYVQAQPNILQTAIGVATTGSTVAATLPNNTTPGSTLLALIGAFNATVRAVLGVAVSPGSGTFARIINQVGTASYGVLEAWAAPSIGAGATPTVTVTFNGTISNADVLVLELAQVPNTVQTDGTAAGVAGSASTTMTSSAITTMHANDLIVNLFSPASHLTVGEAGWTTFASSDTVLDVQLLLPGATESALAASATQNTSTVYGGLIFALTGQAAAPSAPVVTGTPPWYLLAGIHS